MTKTEAILLDYEQMLRNKKKWDKLGKTKFKEYVKSHIEQYKANYYPRTVVDIAKKNNVTTQYVHLIKKNFKNLNKKK